MGSPPPSAPTPDPSAPPCQRSAPSRHTRSLPPPRASLVPSIRPIRDSTSERRRAAEVQRGRTGDRAQWQPVLGTLAPSVSAVSATDLRGVERPIHPVLVLGPGLLQQQRERGKSHARPCGRWPSSGSASSFAAGRRDPRTMNPPTSRHSCAGAHPYPQPPQPLIRKIIQTT